MDILKSTFLFCRGRERVVVADSVGAIVVGWVVSADDDDYFQKYFFFKAMQGHYITYHNYQLLKGYGHDYGQKKFFWL